LKIRLSGCALWMLCTLAMASEQTARTLDYTVLRELVHDVSHYTQGLVLHDGKLIESTGQYGRSALYEKDLDSGRVLRRFALDAQLFGEGVTVFRERIWQLTWRERIGLLFDLDLKPLGNFRYRTEGWGLTHDGRQLIMSDGSAQLHFLDPGDARVTGSLTVRDRGQPLRLLNELEFARGRIWANVWMRDDVAVIHPQSGEVEAWVRLAPLRQRFDPPPGWDPREHVLNGIAHDAQHDRFYVTGKCWPLLFELEIAPVPDAR
jgi:glutaminyl-peptide cyclotransferase